MTQSFWVETPGQNPRWENRCSSMRGYFIKKIQSFYNIRKWIYALDGKFETPRNQWEKPVRWHGSQGSLLLYGVPPPKSPVSLLYNLGLPSWVSAPPSSSPKFSLSHFFLCVCRNATLSSPPIDLSFITLGKAITLISLSLKVNKQLDHFNYFPK